MAGIRDPKYGQARLAPYCLYSNGNILVITRGWNLWNYSPIGYAAGNICILKVQVVVRVAG